MNKAEYDVEHLDVIQYRGTFVMWAISNSIEGDHKFEAETEHLTPAYSESKKYFASWKSYENLNLNSIFK